MLSSFAVGDYVRVTGPLNVRVSYGTSQPEISDSDYPGEAPGGTVGRVLDGPRTADGYTWYKVDYGGGAYVGWSSDHRLESSTARVAGTDVSKWQGAVDWTQVYQSGHQFAFAKATGGDDAANDDPRYVANATGGHAAGVFVGAYHFAYPDLNPALTGPDSAEAEALRFVSVVKPYLTEGYMRPALDLERGAGLGKAALSAWVRKWLETVQGQTGVEPVIYANSNYANNYLDSSLNTYDLWLAHWTYDLQVAPNDGVWNGWSFWQYSGDHYPPPSGTGAARIPGIPARALPDLFNGDRARLVSEFVIGRQPAPEISVLGNGAVIADGDATPTTADHTDFGAVIVGQAGPQRTYTVRNDGDATLSLGTVAVPSGFTLVEGLPGSLVAGASDSFTVRLNTAAAGTFAGDVSFANGDGDESPFNFRITGTVYTPARTVMVDNGRSSNRVDVVFLGDGYTAGELGTSYVTHAGAMLSHLFNEGEDPFPRYRSFFNVYRVDVISNEAGADVPPEGIYRDTALDATYYADGSTERLLYLSDGKAQAALDAALAGAGFTAEMKLVTVNDTRYGGGGGVFAVYAGGNASAPEVALHELGHSFSDLADEYDYSGGATYSGSEPSQPNVTTSPLGTKWSAWLGYTDPDHAAIGPVGAYEGALYHTYNIYRPTADSKMRSLGQPFNAVSREAIIRDIYRYVRPLDGWLDNAGEVRGGDPAVWVDVVDPAVIRVAWSVNGNAVPAASGESFRLSDFGFGPGTYTVTARAYDPTPWVRIDPGSLEQSVSWTVVRLDTVAPSADVVDVTPDPRSAAVDKIAVVFSEPVAGVDLADFTLSRDGGGTLLTASQTLTTSDNVTWELGNLSGLTGTAGGYVLMLSAAGSGISDLAGNALAANASDAWTTRSTIAGRHLFYNNSKFDGHDGFASGDPAANPFDDAAIDPAKEALLPGGGTAAFKNYSSFSRGINGIVIDVAGLPSATLAATDFTFKYGNDSTPGDWVAAADPTTIAVRAGTGGSDRVTLIWADSAIPNGNWLQVTVLANANTGLASADVFYFGSAIGETGNSQGPSPPADAKVNSSDVTRIRNNYSGFGTVGIESVYDINRDGKVNSSDVTITRNFYSGFTPLVLITPPAPAPLAGDGSGLGAAPLSAGSGDPRRALGDPRRALGDPRRALGDPRRALLSAAAHDAVFSQDFDRWDVRLYAELAWERERAGTKPKQELPELPEGVGSRFSCRREWLVTVG